MADLYFALIQSGTIAGVYRPSLPFPAVLWKTRRENSQPLSHRRPSLLLQADRSPASHSSETRVIQPAEGGQVVRYNPQATAINRDGISTLMNAHCAS